MESASPFHNLTPYKYVKQRYAPLAVTLSEPDVDHLFKECNISFADLFSVIASTQIQPLRIIPHFLINEDSQNTFFSQVFNDCTIFSQSFIFPEYETEDTTVPQLSPIPYRFPTKFHYPSPEAARPPWYVLMVENLLKSMQYSQFDFSDCPCCIIYATLAGSSLPLKKADEIKKLIRFPSWMNEFLSNIPMIRIVISDGLNPKAQNTPQPSGSFSQVINLKIRSRKEDEPTDLDTIYLQNLFKYDEKLLNTPNFCKYLSKSDFENVLTVTTSIATTVIHNLETTIKSLEFEQKQSKSFFGKKKVIERFVNGIPWTKLSRIQLGCNYLLLQKVKEAKKAFKSFRKDSHASQELRLFCMFMESICLANSANQQKYNQKIVEIMRNINQAHSIRYLLMVPLLAVEFHSSVNERHKAKELLKAAISKINTFWTGNLPMRALFLGLLYERWAGLTSDRKRSLFLTSRAAYLYKQGNQVPHAIRCYIWLTRGLPHNRWQLLYQTAWFQKASLLCDLTQIERSIDECQQLLGLQDLAPSLQFRIVKQVMVPFREKKHRVQLGHGFTSLLEVKSLSVINVSSPKYWGFDPEEFDELIEMYDKYMEKKMSRSVSFDSWYEDEPLDKKKRKSQIQNVGVGTTILVKLSLYNRYKFPIKLAKCTLKADFHHLERGKTAQIQPIKSMGMIAHLEPSHLGLNKSKTGSFDTMNDSRKSTDSSLIDSTDSNLIEQTDSLLTSSNDSQLTPANESPLSSSNEVLPSPLASSTENINSPLASSTENINSPLASSNENFENAVNESPKAENLDLNNEKSTVDSTVTLAPELELEKRMNSDEVVPEPFVDNEPTSNLIPLSDNDSDDFDDILNDEQFESLLLKSNPVLEQQHQKIETQIQQEHQIMKQNEFLDSFSQRFYKIDVCENCDIPGKKETDLSFSFIPLSEGKFTICRLVKNYWGYFDNEIACGPISFNAKNSHPQLMMQIIDFPEKCYFGQCTQFSIKLINTGTALIKEVCLFHDRNDAILCLDGHPQKHSNISLVVLKKIIEPKETAYVKMIFWANGAQRKNNKTEDFHFGIASNGHKCGYQKKVTNIMRAAVVDCLIKKKKNDIGHLIIQTSIKSLVDNFQFVGFINQNSKYLRILNQSSISLTKGETLSITGLTTETNETAESWRSAFSDDNAISILFKINDSPICAQTNMKFSIRMPKYKLHIQMPNIIKLKSHTKCIFTLHNDTDSTSLYIRPMPIEYVNEQPNEKKSIRPVSSSIQIQKINNLFQKGIVDRNSPADTAPLASCRWIGKTTDNLKNENYFSVSMTFVPLATGIYQLPGAYISTNPNFMEYITVSSSTTFQVVSE